MLFDGHGDVWTDVTCKRVDNHETDIFRKYHLKKFQAGKVTGGIFVIWIDPPYDKDPAARSKHDDMRLLYENDIRFLKQF